MKEPELWFNFLFGGELPRTTTRQEYKLLSHWLRFCRREVCKKVNLSEFMDAVKDTIIYGTGIRIT